MATAAQPDSAASAPAAKTGKKRTLVLLLILGVCGGAAGTYFMYGRDMLGAGGEAKAALRDPIYVSLEPPFVVNLENSDLLRFLQIEIQVMTRDPEAVAALERHAPAIRNNLLLIFAAQDVDMLGSRAGKTALQEQVTQEINAILAERAGGALVDETYFTSFVMQ